MRYYVFAFLIVALLFISSCQQPIGADVQSVSEKAVLPSTGLKGDINEDCVVDLDDFFVFVDAFNEFQKNQYMDIRTFDLNVDGKIDVGDFSVFSRLFGRTCNDGFGIKILNKAGLSKITLFRKSQEGFLLIKLENNERSYRDKLFFTLINPNNETLKKRISCRESDENIENLECIFEYRDEFSELPGVYSFFISSEDTNGQEIISDTINFRVISLPNCDDLININEQVGIKGGSSNSSIDVVFVSDVGVSEGYFKEESVKIAKGVFEQSPIFNHYKNRFNFYQLNFIPDEDLCLGGGELGIASCSEAFLKEVFQDLDACNIENYVILSRNPFRAHAGKFTPLQIFGFTASELVLTHELGHTPIGLSDTYCERQQKTNPFPYPNTFSTKEECESYINGKFKGVFSSCAPICSNKLENGYIPSHKIETMMGRFNLDRAEFGIEEQARINHYFNCLIPEDKDNLPGYCKETPLDKDRDGVPLPLDCDDNNYAVHPNVAGIPFISSIDSESGLSESESNVDYNCDGVIEQQCDYLPKCQNIERTICFDKNSIEVQEKERTTACNGGCSGESGEWKHKRFIECGANKFCKEARNSRDNSGFVGHICS